MQLGRLLANVMSDSHAPTARVLGKTLFFLFFLGSKRWNPTSTPSNRKKCLHTRHPKMTNIHFNVPYKQPHFGSHYFVLCIHIHIYKHIQNYTVKGASFFDLIR